MAICVNGRVFITKIKMIYFFLCFYYVTNDIKVHTNVSKYNDKTKILFKCNTEHMYSKILENIYLHNVNEIYYYVV